MTKQVPSMKGLVLAGGQSQRMGHDKGKITWHGKPQRVFLVELLEGLGIPTYISCRPDQLNELGAYKTIVDQSPAYGPLGGIYSAFLWDQKTAWLMVACDMPLLDSQAVVLLLAGRRAEFAATAFVSPTLSGKFPEPLFAIWEPAAFAAVQQKIAENNLSVRDTLLAAGVFLLDAPNAAFLDNVNTPEDVKRVGLRSNH